MIFVTVFENSKVPFNTHQGAIPVTAKTFGLIKIRQKVAFVNTFLMHLWAHSLIPIKM